MYRSLLVGLSLLFVANSAPAENAFFCTADKSTGFSFQKDSGEWAQTKFNTQNEKYILRPMTKEERFQHEAVGAYALFKLGETDPEIRCTKAPYISGDNLAFVNCSYFGSALRFAQKTLRYVITFQGSYILDNPESTDTPYIEIGKCSPLN